LKASFLLVITRYPQKKRQVKGLAFKGLAHLISLRNRHAPQKNTCSKLPSSNISIGKLIEVKKAALRRHVWFRLLDRIERGIVDLTVRYIDNIRSQRLAKIVTAIVEKLQSATETTLDRLVRTIGLPLAQKISDLAIRLGNTSAALWVEDLTFAKYLAMSSHRT
jgi:hypothetical protein